MSDTGPVDTPAPDLQVLVRVLPPFDAVFPGVYEVVKSAETGEWKLAQELAVPDPTTPAPPPEKPASILVRVKQPFDVVYPDTYEVEEVSETGAWKIAGGVDFDPSYLEQVT